MPPERVDYRALKSRLEQHYPCVDRISVSLCGDVLLAQAVTREVLRQSLRIQDHWNKHDADALRWFAHHTVLTARQAIARQQIDPANDVLRTLSNKPAFATILRTIRFIPPQQREAFLLHHGEQFDLRQLATAMDCSAEAAANHLVAATNALRPVAANRLGEFTAALPQLLAQLVPPRETIAVEAERQTRRYLWPQRLKRWVGWPLVWVAIAAGAFYAWRFWKILEI